MKGKYLSNQELEKIERSLFKSVQSDKTELGEILDSPKLFNSIKQQINREKPESNQSGVRFWLIGYAITSFLVVGFLFLSGYYLVNLPPKITDEAVLILQPEKEFQPIEEDSQPILKDKPRNFVKNKLSKITEKPKKAIKQKAEILPAKFDQSKKRLSKSNKILPENSNPFYALNGRENLDNANEGMSIVRADFSRAELLALGVEVLNDIGDEKVKTELLVGNDGQPRAIRFIK